MYVPCSCCYFMINCQTCQTSSTKDPTSLFLTVLCPHTWKHTHPDTHQGRCRRSMLSVCQHSGPRASRFKTSITTGGAFETKKKKKRIEGYWEMLLCEEVFQAAGVNAVNLTLWTVSFHVSSSSASCLRALYLWPLSSPSLSLKRSLTVVNFCSLLSV